MSVLKRGADATSADINILFAIGGNPQDPVEVYVALYYVDNGTEILLDNIAQRTPVRYDIGKYYCPYHVPSDAPIGTYLAKWIYRPTTESGMRQECDEWYVVAETVQTSSEYNDIEKQAIWDMRIILRDNNPDRNYSISSDTNLQVKIGNDIIELTIGELYDIINS